MARTEKSLQITDHHTEHETKMGNGKGSRGVVVPGSRTHEVTNTITRASTAQHLANSNADQQYKTIKETSRPDPG